MTGVLLAVVVAYAALCRHLYQLQVLRHDELHEKARRKYTACRTESGQRGRIYDVAGHLLAGNMPCKEILAEPRRFKSDPDDIIAALSEELAVDRRLLQQRFALTQRKGRAPVEVVVKHAADLDQANRVAGYHFRGVRLVDTYRRFYPKGSLLANVLGFLDSSGKGASGVEQWLDPDMQPTAGQAVFERDRKGMQIQTGEFSRREARNGADVYLTVREPLQQIMEDELAHLAETFAPKAAYAVMAAPGTGAILALAQWPTFNPNDRTRMTPTHWRNRILTDGFEPGSIMKPLAIAGALDYNVMTLDNTFDCERGYWVYCRRPLRDCHAYDDLTGWEILQKSSNIGVAKIALAMGESRLFQTLTRFGFGERTEVGFPQEASGIFRGLTKWDGLSITRFPIGQGILATPLQLVQAYCALANDGLMMQLRMVDRIQGSTPEETQHFPPCVRRRAVRPHAAREVTQALKLVTTEEGTAPRAAVDGHEVAGKTGTAQKVERYQVDGQWKGHYVNRYVSSFIGFVPADDPAFVLLVVADEPSRGGHYGGTVAAPSFSRIAERSLRYLQVAPSAPSIVSAPTDRLDAQL